MKILVSEIPEGHGRIEREVPAKELDLEAWIRAKGAVEIRLETDRRGQQITLRGVVAASGDTECARCLREFRTSVEAPLIVLADRRGSDDPRDEEALEQEGAVLYHEGVELDLGPAVREAVILEIPQVVLCRPECLGLCSQCGQDRNAGQCGCSATAADPRWERLKSLKNTDPGGSR